MSLSAPLDASLPEGWKSTENTGSLLCHKTISVSAFILKQVCNSLSQHQGEHNARDWLLVVFPPKKFKFDLACFLKFENWGEKYENCKPKILLHQHINTTMTTIRRFTCDDLFRFNNINLDALTETVS